MPLAGKKSVFTTACCREQRDFLLKITGKSLVNLLFPLILLKK
jgi:hypothetical protein